MVLSTHQRGGQAAAPAATSINRLLMLVIARLVSRKLYACTVDSDLEDKEDGTPLCGQKRMHDAFCICRTTHNMGCMQLYAMVYMTFTYRAAWDIETISGFYPAEQDDINAF